MQVIISLILACVIGLSLADQVPVLLWGTKIEPKSSLVTIYGDELTKMLSPLLAKKACVVFLDENLTNKDFLCKSAADGKSCFKYLPAVRDKMFYAAVKNPVKVLRSFAGAQEQNFVDASGKLSKPLDTAAGNIYFVKLNNSESTERENILKSYDSIFASLSSQLGNDVFFMYTSAPSSSLLKRQRRQNTEGSQGYVFREGSKLLLYFTSLSIIDDKNNDVKLDVESMTVKSENATDLSVILKPKTGSSLTFDVSLAGGYFFMKNVVYNNNVKFLSSEVYAPTDFSYFCGNLTLKNIAKDNIPAYTLKWNSLQFQAPFGKTDNSKFVFGDAWHCVGFFTGGILSGLLIVALLLTITFIGVCWMMDINTMDRFDDPKGKTITINASD